MATATIPPFPALIAGLLELACNPGLVDVVFIAMLELLVPLLVAKMLRVIAVAVAESTPLNMLVAIVPFVTLPAVLVVTDAFGGPPQVASKLPIVAPETRKKHLPGPSGRLSDLAHKELAYAVTVQPVSSPST